MSTELLKVEKRDTHGKRLARQLRRAGRVPAVLYGHKQVVVSLSIAQEDIESAVRHRAHLVQLAGCASETALLKEIQWDTFGTRILHVDLARVSADEKVEVELDVLLRGHAPGANLGGMVEQQTRSVTIECQAIAIPESLTVQINHLGIGDSITAAQLELPSGARLITPGDTVIVTCVVPAQMAEVIAEPAGEAEPEVIGRKPAESDEEA
jgi:large subunit ribosomal protein L25